MRSSQSFKEEPHELVQQEPEKTRIKSTKEISAKVYNQFNDSRFTSLNHDTRAELASTLMEISGNGDKSDLTAVLKILNTRIIAEAALKEEGKGAQVSSFIDGELPTFAFDLSRHADKLPKKECEEVKKKIKQMINLGVSVSVKRLLESHTKVNNGTQIKGSIHRQSTTIIKDNPDGKRVVLEIPRNEKTTIEDLMEALRKIPTIDPDIANNIKAFTSKTSSPEEKNQARQSLLQADHPISAILKASNQAVAFAYPASLQTVMLNELIPDPLGLYAQLKNNKHLTIKFDTDGSMSMISEQEYRIKDGMEGPDAMLVPVKIHHNFSEVGGYRSSSTQINQIINLNILRGEKGKKAMEKLKQITMCDNVTLTPIQAIESSQA